MKSLLLIFVFVALRSGSAEAQGDTINRTDTAGKKQGYWVVFAKDKKPAPAYYSAMDKFEEGNYKDNKKAGVWISFWPKQTIKSEITFVDGKPKGYARINFESGKINEEGIWENNRWVGYYKMYYENGCLRHEWEFSKAGKRDGPQKYHHTEPCNALWMTGMMKDGKEIGVWITYDAEGKVINKKSFYEAKNIFDSTYIKPKPILPDTLKPKPPESSICNGYAKLYNSNKQLSQDGVFKSCKLWEGKNYVYSKEGLLVQIKMYKEGKYIGDAPILIDGK